jgi:hypothetical protein
VTVLESVSRKALILKKNKGVEDKEEEEPGFETRPDVRNQKETFRNKTLNSSPSECANK